MNKWIRELILAGALASGLSSLPGAALASPIYLPAAQSSSSDLGLSLVEQLAYLGDILSFYQDRAASEGYLGTACTWPC